MKLALFAIAVASLAAQPKFEAASVKRTDPGIVGKSLGPGTVVLKGIPLKPILAEAFKVKPDQIVGPSWLDDDCFEIVAKMPEGATSDQLPAMLQALLVERFKLAARKEDRPRAIYALVVDKNGPKLKESDASAQTGRTMFRSGPGIAGFKGSMTMATLALRFSGKLDRPVQDFTGLTGKYDVDLTWTPDPASEPYPDIFTAVRESLGLRLEPRKEPVETLVIDHINRIPTEN